MAKVVQRPNKIVWHNVDLYRHRLSSTILEENEDALLEEIANHQQSQGSEELMNATDTSQWIVGNVRNIKVIRLVPYLLKTTKNGNKVVYQQFTENEHSIGLWVWLPHKQKEDFSGTSHNREHPRSLGQPRQRFLHNIKEV